MVLYTSKQIPSITLKNVLHIPKLSTNLVFIQKLTNDISCIVIFHNNCCVFQDKESRRTIERHKEGNDHFLLKEPYMPITHKDQSYSFMSKSLLIIFYSTCVKGLLVTWVFILKQKSESLIDVLYSFYHNLSTSSELLPKIFGCVSFVHVHGQHKGELDSKALMCAFVGYSHT
ncbi:hypothetical protein CR513_25750, partial [Mucuna pruriens]